MVRLESLSRGDFRIDLVRAIAKPGRGRGPKDVINSLTEQGADPCDLRRQTRDCVEATGGPSSRLLEHVADAFAEHDADLLFGPSDTQRPTRQGGQ